VPLQRIDSFDSPSLAPYRTLRYQFEHRKEGIFVAEGENAVRRLIASPLEIVSAVVPEHLVETYQSLLASRDPRIPLYVAPKKFLETLTGFPMYQGVMAVGKVPTPITLEELLLKAPRPLLLVAADGVSSSQNIGALVRNCAAFNAGGLLIDNTSCSPYLRRAITCSAGTVFSLRVVELESLGAALRKLREAGVRCVGAHPPAVNHPIARVSLKGDCCLIVGSEGPGITRAVLDECDELAAIPMPPGIDSLNVATAAAVFLYEAGRQCGH
jgi:tRNA G18 (ribose-2'-O)-methylase SpoU